MAGCGGAASPLRYHAVMTVEDATKMPILFDVIERVLLRKFAALDVKQPEITIIPEGKDSAIVSIEVASSDDQKTVENIMTDTFSFDMRLDMGTETVDGVETTKWESAGVDGSMLNWVQAVGNRQTSQVNLELSFDETGKAKLQELAKTQKGKRLGIFVRDVLVSVLQIESGSFADVVVIGGIPSATVAEIFADDVNVGLHVTFTPL